MSRRKLVGLVAVVAVLGVVTGLVGAGIASGLDPATAPVQYSAKFVCGFEGAEDYEQVKPGNYATAINVHNVLGSSVRGDYQIALASPIGYPAPPKQPAVKLSILKRRVAVIDCITIWTDLGVPVDTFVEGMILIGLPIELPVAAVYTSQTDIDSMIPGPDPGAGISIDVEYLTPFWLENGHP